MIENMFFLDCSELYHKNLTLELCYLIAIHPHGLGGLLAELVPVKAGGSAVVFLLGVGGVAVVGPEEGLGPSVAPELHLPELLPRPVGVEVGGPDEGQVDSQRPANIHIGDLI